MNWGKLFRDGILNFRLMRYQRKWQLKPLALEIKCSRCGGGGGGSVIPSNSPTPITGSYVITGIVYDHDGELVGEGCPVTLYRYEEGTEKLTSSDAIVQTSKTDADSKYTFRLNETGYFWIKSISKDGITPLYSHLFEIISQWLDIPVGFAPGPTGPTGPTGLPGSTGATGPTGSTGATGPVNLATLRVYVYHTSATAGNEISDAEVSVSWHGVTGKETEPFETSGTSGNGYYEFTDLPMGEYDIEVEKDGYEPESEIVVISSTTPPSESIVLTVAYPEMILVNDVANGPFYMGKYEVTNKEYELFDSGHSGNWSNPDYPVETVSWYDACDYCNWLSSQHGFTQVYDGSYNINYSADGYRLPDEDEWEFACRAGSTTDFFWGENYTDPNMSPGEIDFYCWYEYNSGAQPHEVTTLSPNPIGLYHMSGNVWEWCNDLSTDARVMRGGSWFPEAVYCQSSYSFLEGPDNLISDIGFRLVRN